MYIYFSPQCRWRKLTGQDAEYLRVLYISILCIYLLNIWMCNECPSCTKFFKKKKKERSAEEGLIEVVRLDKEWMRGIKSLKLVEGKPSVWFCWTSFFVWEGMFIITIFLLLLLPLIFLIFLLLLFFLFPFSTRGKGYHTCLKCTYSQFGNKNLLTSYIYTYLFLIFFDMKAGKGKRFFSLSPCVHSQSW